MGYCCKCAACVTTFEIERPVMPTGQGATTDFTDLLGTDEQTSDEAWTEESDGNGTWWTLWDFSELYDNWTDNQGGFGVPPSGFDGIYFNKSLRFEIAEAPEQGVILPQTGRVHSELTGDAAGHYTEKDIDSIKCLIPVVNNGLHGGTKQPFRFQVRVNGSAASDIVAASSSTPVDYNAYVYGGIERFSDLYEIPLTSPIDFSQDTVEVDVWFKITDMQSASQPGEVTSLPGNRVFYARTAPYPWPYESQIRWTARTKVCNKSYKVTVPALDDGTTVFDSNTTGYTRTQTETSIRWTKGIDYEVLLDWAQEVPTVLVRSPTGPAPDRFQDKYSRTYTPPDTSTYFQDYTDDLNLPGYWQWKVSQDFTYLMSKLNFTDDWTWFVVNPVFTSVFDSVVTVERE